MGGFNSGRTWYGGKNTTDTYFLIDVMHLHRNELLKPDISFVYERKNCTTQLPSIRVSCSERYMSIYYNVLFSNGELIEKTSAIEFVRTDCNYGGQRPWILCPCCERRVAIIYFVNQVFACRHCHKLVYKSQAESKENRARRQAMKIRLRLGWDADIYQEEGGKPPRMHWKTYNRLIHDYDMAVNEAVAWFVRILSLSTD